MVTPSKALTGTLRRALDRARRRELKARQQADQIEAIITEFNPSESYKTDSDVSLDDADFEKLRT